MWSWADPALAVRELMRWYPCDRLKTGDKLGHRIRSTDEPAPPTTKGGTPMALSVGVIGTGTIGRDHIRRLTEVVPGARVTAVTDPNTEIAAEVGAWVGATVHSGGQAVIDDSAVDAVVVASWGPTHEDYVLGAIAAGKPVFCEKPLATTRKACVRIIEAEVAHGSRLVQVGFMRRYDPAYGALKAVLDSGKIGTPLLFHSVHRNPDVPRHYAKDMVIEDTAVHDFDVARWLFDAEIAAIRVLAGTPNSLSADLPDPLLLVAETTTGALVDIETSVNVRYGYDIRGEVVGETGTVMLADPGLVAVRSAGSLSHAVPTSWRERFRSAFDDEFAEWVRVISATGVPIGPSSWDGYATTAVCEAGLESLYGGDRVEVRLIEKPDLYR
jgi:myo-inositol 2-dehydrogenase / D-chiro-inositol 1-dehydrogenase